jgi:tetratricopeptide (TPR) repeat protein
LNEASDIFHRIIDEAPTFASAYSSLVQIANARHLIFPGIYRSDSLSEESLTLAKQAVSIDPLSSRAHLCLAWSHMLRSEFDQAEFRYALARDLNENDTWTLVSSGQGLAFAGRHTQAQGFSDEALLLNSHLSPVEWGYQVGTRFLCGDYEMAYQAAEKAGDVTPNLPAWKAASLLYLDRPEEALAEGQRFLGPIRDAGDSECFRHGILTATGVSEQSLGQSL